MIVYEFKNLIKNIEILHIDGTYHYPSIASDKRLSNGDITYFDISLETFFHKFVIGTVTSLTEEKNTNHEIVMFMIITYDLHVKEFYTLNQFIEFLKIMPNVKSVNIIKK